VATSILHLENRKLSFWRGNYDQFERQRAEKLLLQQKQAAKQQATRAHMESFVARFRAKASKARQAQSRLKALEKMAPVHVWSQEHVTPFHFPEAEKAVASPIIALSNVSVGYDAQKPILRHLTLRIDHDDRIALLGANGNGKSTFAKLLAGRLAPQAGNVTVAPGLKVAFFAQHQLDDLYPKENAIDHLRRLLPMEQEAELRARVAAMGIGTAKMLTSAQDLSGGEKARLLIGLACCEGPHLLILDEPTNHLDIDSRSVLVEALNAFQGSVVLIAHDRHLIDATADRLWQVADGTIRAFDGDMDDYRAQILGTSRRGFNKDEQAAHNIDKIKGDERRRDAIAQRAKLLSLRKEIQATEKKMAHLQQEIADIDAALSDGVLYTTNPEKTSSMAKRRTQAALDLEGAENHWLELSQNAEAEQL